MAVTVKGTEGVSKVEATGSPSASTFLRGDYAWGAPAGGGMTLLTTVATTSGTTVVVSGLDLSSYLALKLYFYSIGTSSGTAGHLRWAETSGTTVEFSYQTITTTKPYYGTINHSLINGVFGATASQSASTNSMSYYNAIAGTGATGVNTAIDTATTSITFDMAGGETFNLGSISIYGLK